MAVPCTGNYLFLQNTITSTILTMRSHCIAKTRWLYIALAVICSSRTPESLLDQMPITGHFSRGAGRGVVSPNCSSWTLALYQFNAAAQDCLSSHTYFNEQDSFWSCFLKNSVVALYEGIFNVRTRQMGSNHCILTAGLPVSNGILV